MTHIADPVHLDRFKDVILPILNTLIGAFVGGFFAFWAARTQLRNQLQADKAKDDSFRQELLKWAMVEFRDNSSLIANRLLPAAMEASNEYDQRWEYLASIANSLSLRYYRKLISTGLFTDLAENDKFLLYSGNYFTEQLQQVIFMNKSGQAYYKLINDRQTTSNMLRAIQESARRAHDYFEEHHFPESIEQDELE